jgi:peroxiredoxin
MAAEVGSKAPVLTLPDQDFQPVDLGAEFAKGTTVLAFFPAAFTSVCTKELCTLRDSLAQLNKAKARVLGISVADFTLRCCPKATQFPLLSDFRKAIGYAASVNFVVSRVAKRSVWVVDRQGIVDTA